MKSLIVFFAALVVNCIMSYAQPDREKSSSYLNQKPPGLAPEKFAVGVVSLPDQYEFGSIFSRDGNEFYYAANVGERAEIRVMKLRNGSWSKPQRVIKNETFSYNDQFFSPDERRLYFISDMPLSGQGNKKDYDIWFIKKEGDGWSAPINAGEVINSDKNEYYVSFTQNGTMYFSSNVGTSESNKSNYDIYASKQVNGVFQQPVRLSGNVNSDHYEADVFVAYDESYLIFCGDRPDGLGRGDLLISFKNADGTWTKAKNLGETINTPGHELCPFVTKDGKYFFYTSNKDIYWVDASILKTFRE
jgi:hypothetical protein